MLIYKWIWLHAARATRPVLTVQRTYIEFRIIGLSIGFQWKNLSTGRAMANKLKSILLIAKKKWGKKIDRKMKLFYPMAFINSYLMAIDIGTLLM